MPPIHRILDANANRAREALRVMEESARFFLNDSTLTTGLKNLRHDLAAALQMVPALEANRDTPGDVGTTIKTASEASRPSITDVAIAAGKRLSEALRSLEEFGKTLPVPATGASFSQRIESLRYRGYDLEQRLVLALGSGRARQWKLCVLISESLCKHQPWLQVARLSVQAGADCIQLREKSLDAGELLVRARQLLEITRPAGTSLIVNDRPDVAMLAGADGVHVGQTDLSCRQVRQIVGRQLLVGVSTSNLQQAQQAVADGADYCGVGPMFPTTTKHKDHIVGPDYLRQFVGQFPLTPHLAIGGISPENLSQLTHAGVKGIAVSSCVCAATDPAQVVGQILKQLNQPE